MPRILEGITVFDLTQNVAGPYCTQLLGDFGAQVIKLERPHVGDDARGWAPPTWGDEATTYLALNRNKSSICVDLDKPEGQEIARRIAAKVDVVVHSFKPGSAEARQMGYDDLAPINPSLIYCAISGFGDIGPLRNLPGYDPLIQAYAGIMSVTGHPGDPPLRVGVSIIDMTTGLWSFIGILAAVLERSKSGKGSRVAASLLETGIGWTMLPMINYLATGKVPAKAGSNTPMIAPYEAFATADSWILLATPNERLFSRLCDVLDMEAIKCDDRYATNRSRVAHRDELHAEIERRTRTRPTAEWLEPLRQSGIPCSPIHSLDQVFADPQVRALEMIKPITGFRVPDFHIVDLPLRIDGERASVRTLPPRLGEHTDSVLEMFGYSQRDIAALRASGAIG